MDSDKSELLQRLFVVATELVESAHDAATKGQSAHLTAQGYADAAPRNREFSPWNRELFSRIREFVLLQKPEKPQ